MLTKSIQLRNSVCFHARPSALIATEAQKFESQIMLSMDGKIADAKQMLSIMRLTVSKEKQIEVILDGCDEEDALQAMEKVLSTL